MFFLLFPLLAFAQEDIDLSQVKKLADDLPTVDYIDKQDDGFFRSGESKYAPPTRPIRLKEISKSGIAVGAIGVGKTIYDLKGGIHQVTTKHFYVKHYKLQDEFGYKYLITEKGETLYKINGDDVINIKEETALYVPPLKYTPAPLNMVKREFDQKLQFNPQISLYNAYVSSAFLQDLLDDSKAGQGYSTQYGLSLTTDWDLPINTGLVLHYERASYNLSDADTASYSSLSLGPQFVTKEYDIMGGQWRFQIHFRISPFAKLETKTSTFKFNSADLLFSVDHPIKNGLGEFVISPFFQLQWLNLKDQTDPVSIDASNETNKYFGIALSQVFE